MYTSGLCQLQGSELHISAWDSIYRPWDCKRGRIIRSSAHHEQCLDKDFSGKYQSAFGFRNRPVCSARSVIRDHTISSIMWPSSRVSEFAVCGVGLLGSNILWMVLGFFSLRGLVFLIRPTGFIGSIGFMRSFRQNVEFCSRSSHLLYSTKRGKNFNQLKKSTASMGLACGGEVKYYIVSKLLDDSNDNKYAKPANKDEPTRNEVLARSGSAIRGDSFFAL